MPKVQEHPAKRTSLTFFNHEKVMTEGGYCFQTNALLYSVLVQLEFKPLLCQARGLMGKPVNDKGVLSLPATHVVLVVLIEDQRFFLEPALGMQAPRYPILVEDSQETIIQDWDEFRFYKQDEVFVLQKKLRDAWFNLIQTPLVETTEEALQKNLLKLERFPNPLAIRDEKILVGQVTDSGSKSFYWDIYAQQLKFMYQEDGVFKQKILKDWSAACELLSDEFDIHSITPKQLKIYCSPLPTPKRRWEIDLPITNKDRDLMAANLSFSM